MTADQSPTTTSAAAPSSSPTSTSSSSPSSLLSNYTILGIIGTGSFGRVSKIKRLTDGCICVMKELHYGNMNDKEKQQLVQEVNILRELQHPNIVRYIDRIIEREQKIIYIIMEFCAGGDLSQCIKNAMKQQKHLVESDIWRYLTQICQALYVCHYRGTNNNKKESVERNNNSTTSNNIIIHRDIKPGNIFLDHQRNIKLGDFGLARVLGEGSIYAQTTVGTPYYMSPEQVAESCYNTKSDIWSLGCLIYELCTLRPPFNANSHLALALKIQQGKYTPIPSVYSNELSKLIDSMLQVESHRRPSVEQLLNHHKIAMTVKLIQNPSSTANPNTTSASASTLTRHQQMLLDRRSDELKKREQALNDRERQLQQRELQLNAREADLIGREQRVKSHTTSTLPSVASSTTTTSQRPPFTRVTSHASISTDEHTAATRRSTLPTALVLQRLNLNCNAAPAAHHITAAQNPKLSNITNIPQTSVATNYTERIYSPKTTATTNILNVEAHRQPVSLYEKENVVR